MVNYLPFKFCIALCWVFTFIRASSAEHILIGKPIGRLRRKINKKISVNKRNWIDLTRDRDYWKALVNAVATGIDSC